MSIYKYPWIAIWINKCDIFSWCLSKNKKCNRETLTSFCFGIDLLNRGPRNTKSVLSIVRCSLILTDMWDRWIKPEFILTFQMRKYHFRKLGKWYEKIQIYRYFGFKLIILFTIAGKIYVYKSNILIIHFKDHCVYFKTSIIINIQELTSFGFQQDLEV